MAKRKFSELEAQQKIKAYELGAEKLGWTEGDGRTKKAFVNDWFDEKKFSYLMKWRKDKKRAEYIDNVNDF